MSDHKPPLILPVYFSEKTQVTLHENEDQMVLTDGRGTRLKRLLWLWGLGGAAVIGLCAGGSLWVMYLQAQAATPHRLDVTLVGLAITMVVLGTFLAISLPGITFYKSLH